MAKTLVLNGTNFSANKIETVTWGSTIPCIGIELDETEKSVTSMSAFTLIATVEPSDTTDEIVWSSSDETIAIVSDGVVTPLALGEVTISVSCGNQNASCAIDIDNVVPNYKVVSGYNPYRRTSTGSAATTGKRSVDPDSLFILANDLETGLYPIESKTDVDTSPYRFVPIMIPKNAVKIIISSINQALGKMKSRSLYFDSTKPETTYGNGGAFVVTGTSPVDGYDQQSTQVSPLVLTIPDVEGFDSCAFALAFQYGDVAGLDYSDVIKIAFTYKE